MSENLHPRITQLASRLWQRLNNQPPEQVTTLNKFLFGSEFSMGFILALTGFLEASHGLELAALNSPDVSQSLLISALSFSGSFLAIPLAIASSRRM